MEIKDKEEVNFNINSEEDFPSLCGGMGRGRGRGNK